MIVMHEAMIDVFVTLELIKLFAFPKNPSILHGREHKFQTQKNPRLSMPKGKNRFNACVTDVMNAYVQCEKYLGFDMGQYMGTDPDTKKAT